MDYEAGSKNQVARTIKKFTDLLVWQNGHKLVLEIYKVTDHFPKEESFGLTSQIRRCAVSITSNVAEGFSRKTYKEKVNFYYISLGSVTELQNQLLIARDLRYISKEEFYYIAEKSVVISKLINGLIKSSRKKIRDS